MMTNTIVVSLCLFHLAHGLQRPPVRADETHDYAGLECGNAETFFHPGTCAQRPTTTCTTKMLPSFLYLGLPHAASTTVAWQLNMHPNLSYGRFKEHCYFTTVGRNDDRDRSVDAYLDQFEVDCTVEKTFDATPHDLYLSYAGNESGEAGDRPPAQFPWEKPGIAAVRKVRKMLGEHLKLILMIRDPIDEAISQTVPNTVDEFQRRLDRQGDRLCYANYVEGWLEVFPRRNVHFIDFSKYLKNQNAVLQQVFRFLGVNHYKYSEKDFKPLGRRRTSSADVGTHEVRREYHSRPTSKHCKKRLEHLTGMTFSWSGAE